MAKVKLRFLFLTALVLSLINNFMWGQQIDPDPRDFGSENITQPAKRTPFSFETHIDVIGNAKVGKGYYKDDEVLFSEADAELGMIVYYAPAYQEGLRLALAFTTTYLHWEQNPWFEQDLFNIATLNIVGFTGRLDKWFWRASLGINVDTDIWQLDYTSYDILLWGRYDLYESIKMHLGFWAETGINLNRIWPIIGAEWQISKKWKLNLIYPVNIALEYTLLKNWSLALAGRNFNTRFRSHEPEHHTAKSLVRYENIGAEFMVKYEGVGITANIHAGITLGGKYRLADRRNHHPYNLHIDPSGYVGAEIDVSF